MSRFADGEFDVVPAFGGPLPCAFEDTEAALRRLHRIARPGGVVVGPVMSVLGTWLEKVLGTWLEKVLGTWLEKVLGTWLEKVLGIWLEHGTGVRLVRRGRASPCCPCGRLSAPAAAR